MVSILRPGQRILNIPGYGVQTSRRATAAGNGLLNNLVAYWPLNEASGNALDLHSNGLTLTDQNTVTSNTGKVYALARKFSVAANEGFYRSSESLLQTGGATDFTFAIWLNLTTNIKPQALVAKRSAADAGEFASFYGLSGKFEFFVRDSDWRGVNANTFGAPSTGVWYLVIMQHVSSTKTISISVNAGAEDTNTYAGTFSTTTATFGVGNEIYAPYAPSSAANMVAGPVAMWKSAAGGGGVLSSSQRSALWNAGNGLAYANFTT